ncbi:MAG: FecR domain-containing protein [Odoribacteraceae bacterium]|jgi:ferric-dicitrate binding protein FerR (iron transport regulator)|nr:FecR domain-containing protein [Odoribacteraceae bacterium]
MEKWTEWVVSYCKHEFSRAERAGWQAWMQSGENKRLFSEATRAYRQARRVAAWERADERLAWQRVARDIARPSGRLSRRLFIVAACVALLLGGAYWLSRQTPSPPALSWEEMLPGERRAVLRLPDGREMALGAGVVVTDTMLGFRGMPDTIGLSYRDVGTPAGSFYHVLIVPRGGEYFLVLSDGSRVWLNADSELRYPASFAGDRREVFLRGEAYFQVSGDARPFIVESGGTRVEVIGTQFNVAAYRDETRVVTTLEKGRVRVRAGDEERVLEAGTRAVWTGDGLEVSMANLSIDLGWIHRVFDFVEMPLGEITRQLQRWYDVEFVYRDAGIEGIPFTGTVGRDLPLQDVLRVIEQLAEIRFSLRDGKIEVTRNNNKKEERGNAPPGKWSSRNDQNIN